MSEPITLSVTVFPEDDPALYTWVANLPKSRQRRRTLVVQALRSGVKGPAVVEVGSAPAVASVGPVEKQPSEPVPPAGRPDVSFTQVAVEDLTEIFGKA